MKIGMSSVLFTCALIGSQQAAVAQDIVSKNAPMSEKEVRQLQQKTQAIIDVLVKKGILDTETARALTANNMPITSTNETAEQPSTGKPVANDPDVVRVPYVSKAVREQIREEVKNDLKKDVVDSVLEKAKDERWGVPMSWPNWINKVTFKGDVRFRFEDTQFADGNSGQYIDVLAVNKAGGTVPAGLNAFLNTTENADRLRVRARLNFDVKTAPNWNVGFRLSTGKATNPVSSNVTLSNDMSDFELNLTRAFISYQTDAKNLTIWAGRFDNPWLSTDLVWDEDLGFGGVAARYAPMHEDRDQEGFDPFITAGVFPIDEIALSSNDKWLYGVQAGFNYLWESENSLKFGVAYYDYANMVGKFNSFGSNKYDYTAPKWAQKGNTLFDIRNDDNINTQFAALASDYNEANMTLIYDFANFAPTHIFLISDYVRNIGFNADKNLAALEKQTGLNFKSASIRKDVDGYKFEIMVGHPSIVKLGDWNVSLAYKSLGSDAVLDAFTDSDFHLGGTDGAGYIITGRYGLADNVSVSGRLLSSNAIHGAPLGVDIFQLDLNVKF